MVIPRPSHSFNILLANQKEKVRVVPLPSVMIEIMLSEHTMPPPKLYTKEQIFAKAFEMVVKEGIGSLTARALSRKLKSSVVPIYTHFPSMNRLRLDVVEKGIDLLKGCMEKDYTDDPASNMGIGIVLFARGYPNLFRALYLDGAYTAARAEFDLHVRQMLYGTRYFRHMAEADFDALFLKLIAFIQGYCTLVCTGEVDDISIDAIDRYVSESCDPIIYQAIFKTDFTRLLTQSA